MSRWSAVRGWSRRSRIALVLAIVVLVAVPMLPAVFASQSLLGLIGVPFESLAMVLLVSLLPIRWLRRVLAVLFGLFVVVSILLAAIDFGFETQLDVHFDPLNYQQLGDAYGVFTSAVGTGEARLILTLIGAVGVLTVAALAWAVLRVDSALRSRRRPGTVAVLSVTAGWLVLAVIGAQVVAGQPIASAASFDSIVDTVNRGNDGLAAEAAVPREAKDDPYRTAAPSSLLTSLQGKDVIVAFIESYGQVAVQGTSFSPGVDKVLQRGTAQLKAEGYSAQSAWLTSPTFGGISWLAHSTLETGLWVNEQPLYSTVIRSKRFTLSDAFKNAGWNTISDVPSDTVAWPFGTSFYHFGTLLDTGNVGYQGPKFGYAQIPDEYTWKYFDDHYLEQPHQPVMAEIDFVSSHTPWAPLPSIVPWSKVGDGSIYDPQPASNPGSNIVWQNPKHVRSNYGKSVQYSMQSMLEFLKHSKDPNLVLVVLGDHQPATIVSGKNANHEVPISIIAKDPKVMKAIAGWHWTDGLQPPADAPLWPMSAFRNRFFKAFS